MASWVTHSVDTAGPRGAFCKLINLGNKPAIAYFVHDSEDEGQLWFARSTQTSPSQSSHWAKMMVDELPDDGGTGYTCDATVVGTKAAIAYKQVRDSIVRYAKAGIAAPVVTGDWTKHTVQVAPARARNIDLSVVNSKPAIAFFDEAKLKFRYAAGEIAEPVTSADWTVHDISTGTPASFKGKNVRGLDGSLPRLLAIGNGTIYYHPATLALPDGPEDWTTPHGATASALRAAYDLDALLVASKPACAFRELTNGSLYYARSTVVAPDELSDWAAHQVYDNEFAGEHIGLGLIDTMPAIAFSDLTPAAEKVRFAYSDADEPTSGSNWTVETVANAKPGAVSLLQIGAVLFIAYYDLATRDLVVAVGTP